MRAATGKGDNTITVDDDRKECPNCKRKFNQIACERHIPICNAKFRAKGIRI